MHILGIGEVVIDQVQTVQGGLHDTTHVGGPVTAALIVLARLGETCHYVTSVGDDSGAQIISKVLESEGIDVTYNHQTATKVNTMVIDETGQRTKLRSNTRHVPITDVPVELIQRADLIIVDRHEPEAFRAVMRHKRPSAQVIIDPSTEVSEYTLHMMQQAEHPIVPIETLAQMDQGGLAAALDKLHSVCTKPVVITLGELGSMVYDGTNTELIPPVQVDVIDTTGAGDVYRGAYAYGILRGWERARSAAFANAVAGMHCTRLGNHTAIPDSATLLELAETSPTRRELHLDDIHAHYLRLSPQIVTQPV